MVLDFVTASVYVKIFITSIYEGGRGGGGGGGGGGVVAWWLTPQTPDPEVGGSSPTQVAVFCP